MIKDFTALNIAIVMFLLAFAFGFLYGLRKIFSKLEEVEAEYYGPLCPRKIKPPGATASHSSADVYNKRNRVTRVKAIKCDESSDATTGTPATHHPPPRRMSDSTTNPVYFLHIGKAGGTSVDILFKTILKCESKLYVGGSHFDWTFIQRHQKRRHAGLSSHNVIGDDGNYDIGDLADVITLLRNPVSRAISQFYFSKTLPWAKKNNEKFLTQTFDEYLDDPTKEWMQPIADGESGSDFLAGIFRQGGWVVTDGRETPHKEYLRRNKTAACLFAARRLENTTWFGIMEDMERSMKLLQVTLALDDTPVLPRTNYGEGRNPRPSRKISRKIERYIPRDMWLYEYAKRLFEARWNYFMGSNCTYVSPELPPLPDFD